MSKKYKYTGVRFPYFKGKVFPLAYIRADGMYMLYVGNNTGFCAYLEELEETGE